MDSKKTIRRDLSKDNFSTYKHSDIKLNNPNEYDEFNQNLNTEANNNVQTNQNNEEYDVENWIV